MSSQVIREQGVPELLVHAAGCFYIQRFCDRDYDTWERMISLNISGTLALIGEIINPMKVTQAQEPDSVILDNVIADPRSRSYREHHECE